MTASDGPVTASDGDERGGAQRNVAEKSPSSLHVWTARHRGGGRSASRARGESPYPSRYQSAAGCYVECASPTRQTYRPASDHSRNCRQFTSLIRSHNPCSTTPHSGDV